MLRGFEGNWKQFYPTWVGISNPHARGKNRKSATGNRKIIRVKKENIQKLYYP